MVKINEKGLGADMNFSEFVDEKYGKYYSNYNNSRESYIRRYRIKLEKSLKIIFNVDPLDYYLSRDGLNLYWPIQEYDLLKKIEDYVEQEKCVTEKIQSLNTRLVTEKGLIERDQITKKISKLEAKLRKIKRKKGVLENWGKIDEDGKDNHLEVMEILDKDTILSPMDNIEQNTADLFAFIINHKAFDYVSNKVEPYVNLWQMSPDDRKELAEKIQAAYDDENFGKFVDHVIEYRKLVSFLPEIESITGLKCKNNDLNLILYPIMCPHKYMLLRNAYYILLGEECYSDEDALNMLTDNKEPYVNSKEAENWEENPQLSWITDLICSRMDGPSDEKIDTDPSLSDFLRELINNTSMDV